MEFTATKIDKYATTVCDFNTYEQAKTAARIWEDTYNSLCKLKVFANESMNMIITIKSKYRESNYYYKAYRKGKIQEQYERSNENV